MVKRYDHNGFTDRQRMEMREVCMSDPVPLSEADLSRPFVYERRWGVFYVSSGKHEAAMSLLLAFQHGCDCGIDVAEKLGLRYPDDTADRWLDSTIGSCTKSSLSDDIYVGRHGNLNSFECRILSEYFKLVFIEDIS